MTDREYLPVGHIGVDRLNVVLHYDLRSVCVRHETLASVLGMSLRVVAQNHVDAFEIIWGRKIFTRKVIVAHIRGHAQELQFS